MPRQKPRPVGPRPALVARVKDLPDTVKAALAPLNVQQRRFVLAYCGEANGNAGAAARLAGYTQKAPYFQGYHLLKQSHIRAAVEAYMAAFAMTAVELTHRIADLATVHMGPFVEHNATTNALAYKVTAENWERYRHWVRAIDVDPETGAVTRLTLHNAQHAQATLAKILKLFSDAPQFIFRLQIQSASNDEILRRLEEARQAARGVAYLGRAS